jgi:hypothetical protein
MTNYSQIIEFWGIEQGNGICDEDINNALAVLDHLPKALTDYYKQLGNEEALNHTQDELLLPNELEFVGDYLCFYQENQCVAQWCIAMCDLETDNPPIYVTYDAEEFYMESERLTDFLIAMSYLQGLYAFPFASEKMYDISELQASLIFADFAPIMNTFNKCLGVLLFSNHVGSIVALMKKSSECTNEGYFAYYSSRFEEDFKNIDAFFKMLLQ